MVFKGLHNEQLLGEQLLGDWLLGDQLGVLHSTAQSSTIGQLGPRQLGIVLDHRPAWGPPHMHKHECELEGPLVDPGGVDGFEVWTM